MTDTSTTNMVAMTDTTTGTSTTDATTGTGTSGEGTSAGSSTGAVVPCMDGVENGDETDIDCGGGTCLACENGQRCAGKGTNCMSAQCNGDLCVELASCVLSASDLLVEGQGGDGLTQLAVVGDFDGDLLSELLIGAPTMSRAYALLGGTLDQDIDLALVMGGAGGYFIKADPGFGAASAAGDFNMDGLADLAVGGPSGPDVRVVFGRGGDPPFPAIDVQELDTTGFTMSGPSVGSALAGGVDVDGDGDGDLVVGARFLPSPTTYVVFSDANLTDFVASDVGGTVGGFQIVGAPSSGAGGAVALLPSIDGDALAEVVIGASTYSEDIGRAYVVHGKADGAQVNLTQLGTGGFAITTSKHLQLANTVAAAGDVNGDGLADILVGSETPCAYVVFGKADTKDVNVDALGARGFKIDLIGGSTGRVAAAADLNGDGLAEVIVNDPLGKVETVWVVYGKADTTNVLSTDLENDVGGFAIRVAEPAIDFGSAVVVGDLLGLGANTLAVSAPAHAQGIGEVLIFTPGLCN